MNIVLRHVIPKTARICEYDYRLADSMLFTEFLRAHRRKIRHSLFHIFYSIQSLIRETSACAYRFFI